MQFYTAVLRKSREYWVALCLENGVVGQGNTKESAIEKLKEAIQSLQDICEDETDFHSSPIPVRELHEFLSVQADEPAPDSYELRAVNTKKCAISQTQGTDFFIETGWMQLLQGGQR